MRLQSAESSPMIASLGALDILYVLRIWCVHVLWPRRSLPLPLIVGRASACTHRLVGHSFSEGPSLGEGVRPAGRRRAPCGGVGFLSDPLAQRARPSPLSRRSGGAGLCVSGPVVAVAVAVVVWRAGLSLGTEALAKVSDPPVVAVRRAEGSDSYPTHWPKGPGRRLCLVVQVGPDYVYPARSLPPVAPSSALFAERREIVANPSGSWASALSACARPRP